VTRSTRRPWIAGWAVALLVAPTVSAAEGPFELKDGDRVVLLGGTFIERDQEYGYLETLLTARFPDRDITFRNLGWSGDTVRGEARARFGPPAEGFDHLKTHVEALKPTVIFVNYGLNESFAGKAGLGAVEKDLKILLDVLDKTGARIVLITPRRLEKLPPSLPDPARANERLADYVGVLKGEASRRGYRVVDLFDGWKPAAGKTFTDDGIHPTAEGYRRAAEVMIGMLGLEKSPPRLEASWDGRAAFPEGLTLVHASERLPTPPNPPHAIDRDRSETAKLGLRGVPPGSYRLVREGKVVFAVTVPPGVDSVDLCLNPEGGPDAAQAEALRHVINAKNELYFHRWRPQNETYLFGFRKHEQGNNAREIPLFDPLVAAREAEIARLRVPAEHTYEVLRAAGPQ
jgi:lysophospholipase L1-like esterase